MGDKQPSKMDWKQQIGEPDPWYAKFHIYLMLGPARSMLASFNEWRSLQKKTTKQATSIPPTWREKAKRWEWKERASIYDATVREEVEETQAQRRREFIDDEWNVYKECRAKAREILAMPHEREVQQQQDGKIIVVKMPVNFTPHSAIALDDHARAAGERATTPDEGVRTGPKDVDDRPEHEKAYDWFQEFASAEEKDDSDTGNGDGEQAGPALPAGD